MKVLFLCHRLPYPPTRGGKIRPFNIIRHLTESGHQVTVGSLARSRDEERNGAGLAEYCQRVLVGRIGPAGAWVQMLLRLLTTGPSSMGYFFSRSLHREIRDLLERERFDLVFVHCSSAAQYARGVRDTPGILDFGDMDSQKWLDYGSFRRMPLALGYRLEGNKLFREEVRLARLFDVSTCTTRAELDTLRSYQAAAETAWFPNGVDSDFFAPDDSAYDPDKVCFVGRMDYFPNQQAMHFFCREVLPLIQSRRPATRLAIVGAEPSRAIRRLSLLPGIEVTGTVPDVRPHVRSAAVTVAPLLIARGTQNKILESMAMGVPVVASKIAAKGVDAIDPDHILTAESATEYADQVISLLDDTARRTRLAAAARDRMLSHHSWQASMRRLDGIIAELVPDAVAGME